MNNPPTDLTLTQVRNLFRLEDSKRSLFVWSERALGKQRSLNDAADEDVLGPIVRIEVRACDPCLLLVPCDHCLLLASRL